jgi:UDP-N-acetylglucosamine--N-acetylmuramyl-(pentapeptide) pyrophosphoryl-undecaprenol N-acetylglucosamine transferase
MVSDSGVLLLAGGGGHTGYAYALAQALYKRCELYSLVPLGDNLSRERLSRYSSVSQLVKPRGPKTPAYRFVAGLLKSGAKSLRLVKRQHTVVVSTGSNFCIPPSIAAYLKGKRLVNIESSVRFTRASSTARILSRFSDLTVLQWEEQRDILPRGKVYGPLVPAPEAEIEDRGYILVTGGTFGHKLLFDTVSKTGYRNVILQTGRIDQTPYRVAHPEWEIIDFSARFYEYIARASVVVTHFGETALEAALVYRKPTVVVVNPEWTRTVGAEDAGKLASRIGAQLVTELTPQSISKAIELSKTAKRVEIEYGSEKLAHDILEML